MFPASAPLPTQRRREEVTTSFDEINDALLKQLECPICFETCLPPIHMCPNGHNVCNTCRGQLQECPTCRQPGVPSCRNRFAEETSVKVKLPCPNTIDGCPLKFNVGELEQHLGTCEDNYKYPCVLEEITNDSSINDYCVVWHGSRRQLVNHVRQKHPTAFVEEPCTEMLRRVGSSGFVHTDVKMMAVYGQLFWVMMFSDRVKGVEVVPYYVGSRGNEKRFECQLEMTSADGEFRLVCFAPIHNWTANDVDDGKILRLKDELLLSFLEKGFLTVKVTIVKKINCL